MRSPRKLAAVGEDEIVIGSRDAERAAATAAELGGRVTGATNDDAVRGVDLAVLAVNADAALDTARAVAGALGTTPLLCVASAISFERGRGMLPDPDALSLAERVQQLVDAPVAAGLHSVAASNLEEAPDEDALVCGDDETAKSLSLELAGRLVGGRAARRRPARERPCARRVDRGDREPEPPLQGARGHPRHRRSAMIELIPVHGLPEIRKDDDLAALVVERIELQPRDVLVLAQKAVSKAEGRVVRIDDYEASEKAIELAGDERDPREVEVILREAKRIVRERGPLVIAETRHGFVCASAGVDHSNAPEPGTLVLLPVDPDASARAVRDRIAELTGVDVGVSSRTRSGGPFRQGTTDVAIGVAGVPAIARPPRHDRPDRLRAPLEPGRGRRRDRRRSRSRPRQGRGRAGRGRPRPPARRRRLGAGDRDRARARSLQLNPVGASPLYKTLRSSLHHLTPAATVPRSRGRALSPKPRPVTPSQPRRPRPRRTIRAFPYSAEHCGARGPHHVCARRGGVRA